MATLPDDGTAWWRAARAARCVPVAAGEASGDAATADAHAQRSLAMLRRALELARRVPPGRARGLGAVRGQGDWAELVALCEGGTAG